jgi:type I restriction enzyme, R subunit
LAREIAGFPSEMEAEQEEAKRFDLLMFNLQLAYLRSLECDTFLAKLESW